MVTSYRNIIGFFLLIICGCTWIYITKASAQEKPPLPNIEYQTSTEDCSNAIDDDGNGAIDCEDIGCRNSLLCGWCGDGTCSKTENAATCPLDCRREGASAYRNFPSYADIQDLTNMAAIGIDYEDIPEEQAKVAITELQNTINQFDPEFAERMKENGVELSASILDTKGALARTFKKMAEELKEESKELRMYVASLVAKPIVLSRLQNIGVQEQLISAIAEKDLVKTRQYLPKAQRSVSANINKLRMLKEASSDMRVSIDDDRILIPIVIAQEEADIADAKTGFKNAIDTAEEMDKNALEPKEYIDPLLADIQNLQNRKNTLAGILGEVNAEDVDNDLGEVWRNSKDPSTESFISAKGILSYLRSTANFQDLENTYNAALSRMQTGFGSLKSLFAFRSISLKAEAATLLDEEVLQGLSSDDIDERRTSLVSLIEQERQTFEDSLLTLPEDDQELFSTRWEDIEEKLDDIQTTEDTRIITKEFSSLMQEVQSNMRSEKNIFQRMIYRLQDFFGRSSKNT